MVYSADAARSFIPIQPTIKQENWQWMKQLTEPEYADAFELMNIAAQVGSNIGIGEYPTLEMFTTVLQNSVALGIYDGTKVLNALVVLKPYHGVRHVSPILGHIVLASRIHPVEKQGLSQLIKIGCEMAGREDCGGFKGCVAEVFYPCLTHLQGFREEGFVVTCVVPLAGRLTGHKGHLMSYVMYKELSNKSVNNLAYLPQGLSFQHPKAAHYESEIGFVPTMLKCSAPLPANWKCTFKSDVSVTVRHLRPDELRQCYDAFAAAMDQGFGVMEFRSYEMFLRAKVHNSYIFILENSENQEPIMYMYIGQARFTRSNTKENQLGYAGAVMLPKYRGTGLGEESLKIMMTLVTACGYKHVVSTMAITNMPALRSSMFYRSTFIGTLPTAIYFTKYGWTDLAIHQVQILDVPEIRSLL